MEPVSQHPFTPDVSFDGGDMDCGGGLLLMIRRHIHPMPRGGLLEFLSTDSSVESDLAAWPSLPCREFLSWRKSGSRRSYLVCKGTLSQRSSTPPTTFGGFAPPVT